MRVAFATCSAMPGGWEDDQVAADMLGAEFHCWDDENVSWGSFDRVVIRSTWDYTSRAGEFLAWCSRVGAGRLRNRPELVAFNLDKRYLGELRVPVVPTTFAAPGDPVPDLVGEVVVKPNVSAGARDTGRFGPAAHGLAAGLIETIQASGRTALVQPYMGGVDARGETALVFFAGELSHVLRKRAVLDPDEVAPVAEEHLGVARAMLREDLVAAADSERAERELAGLVMREIAARFGMPLYARVDLVPDAAGSPVLLELEVVEPNLFLAHAAGSSERFAAAVLADPGGH